VDLLPPASAGTGHGDFPRTASSLALVRSVSRSHMGIRVCSSALTRAKYGTHVAGIIAASANNGVGGTGVAFNAKIMAIKSFGYAGTGTSTDIAEGIYYAVDNGADIINMSFGSYSESSLVKDALQVAFGTSVLVAAAGNDGLGNLACPPQIPRPADMFPAAYKWVLGVMASTPQEGRADNVTVTLEAFAEGAAGPDLYVTMITDTVTYGSIGTFSEDDNGLAYENGVVTGVDSPFRFRVATDTPNDHTIPFRITVTASNGLDPSDTTDYSFTSRFTVKVQRGREVPSVISEDMALTKDDFWIVTGPVLIEPGITLTISPGTQVQWGGATAASPYANPALEYIQVEGTLLVAGTAEEPVRLFASDTITIPEFGRPSVRIYNIDQGVTHISHAHITHPELGLINKPLIDSISYSLLDGDGTERNSLFLRNGYERHRPGLSVLTQQVVESRIAVERLSWVERGMVPPWFEPIAQYDTVLIDSITGTPGKVPQFRVREMSNSVLLSDIDEGLKIRLLNNTQTTEQLALADTSVRSNAFLSPFWNTDTETWTRFISSFSRDEYFGLTGNYWGGASDELIDLAVVDYFDDFNYGKVVASPSATAAPESTYPFVTDVRLTREASGNLSVVDAGAVTFTVTFNRDMDQTVQPKVGFGPAFPYTDYTVAGDWVDARTWQGSFNVTPLTGDGYQLIRVAGAQALDKPWLVTGNDAGRFRFEIVTSGTLAMNLQASGGEGKVDLSWTQDDFDLLAGYNIYRATSLDGPYTRVNSTIIPKEETSFTDTSVAPAQTYFYTSASCSCPRAATTWPLSANRSSPPATAAAGMAPALARVY
jgi:hypothetical protein